MDNYKISLLHLIDGAKILGLSNADIQVAQDFLTFNELGLSFDTIITQMYEYDIEITIEYYSMISKIGESMQIPLEEYSFMKELIRSDNIIPQPIKEGLRGIIDSLNGAIEKNVNDVI
ncbi:MAG: MafI family immunity protein [Arcicella sp.]|jgi:hypothetical protein|nr:MafI family immunity protein [Arcicella sp.]